MCLNTTPASMASAPRLGAGRSSLRRSPCPGVQRVTCFSEPREGRCQEGTRPRGNGGSAAPCGRRRGLGLHLPSREPLAPAATGEPRRSCTPTEGGRSWALSAPSGLPSPLSARSVSPHPALRKQAGLWSGGKVQRALRGGRGRRDLIVWFLLCGRISNRRGG